MFLTFFRDMRTLLGRLPKRLRIPTAILIMFAIGAFAFGTGPLILYAATSAGGNGSSSVGSSYIPGDSALGVIEPAYFVVTPLDQEHAIRATGTDNADYTLLMDASETSSSVMIPDQNEASLLFIPKLTWNNETGMTGNNSNYWLRDKSTNVGRDCSRYNSWLVRMNKTNSISSSSSAAASNTYIYSSYNNSTKSYDNWDIFNNIVFCELTESMMKSGGMEIGSAEVTTSGLASIEKKGVYRERIYEYITDSTKKKTDYNYYNFDMLTGMSDTDVTKFLKAVVYGGSKESYKNLDDDLVKNSQMLWNAITQITLSGGNYVTHVDRINEFLAYSYNYAITGSSVKGYFSGKTLSDGSALTIDESLITSNSVATTTLGALFNKAKTEDGYNADEPTVNGKNTDQECRVYSKNLYLLGYLDLLLTAYTVSVNQHNINNGKAAASSEAYWRSTIEDYLTASSGSGVEYAPVWINIQVGTMTVQNLSNKDNGSYQLMFASSQDTVDASYGLATVSCKTTDSSSATTTLTMSYPYPGYPVSAGSGGKADIGFNYVGSSSKKTSNTIAERDASKYGTTYYDKLKKASAGSTYSKGAAWYTSFALQRILSKLYSNGTETKSSNVLANIELIKSKVSKAAFSGDASQHKSITNWASGWKSDDGTVTATKIWENIYKANNEDGNTQQMYGSFMIMCAPFESIINENENETAFAAKLTITSAIGTEQSASPEYLEDYNEKYSSSDKKYDDDNVSAINKSVSGIFSIKASKNTTSDNALWGLEVSWNGNDFLNRTHPSLKDAVASEETIRAALEDASSAVIEKDLSDVLEGDGTASVNDTITLNLAVQSYVNKDNKEDDALYYYESSDVYGISAFLDANMKSGTQAKLKVTWTVYKKNPAYTAGSDTDAYGRVLYTAEDKWTDLSTAASKAAYTSLNRKNHPPYYSNTALTETAVTGTTASSSTADTGTDTADDADESFSSSGESGTGASGYTEEDATVSTEEKTAESVLAATETGDSTASESVDTETTDIIKAMFDKTSKKQYVYESYVDEKFLESGLTLRNMETLSGLDGDAWLGQKGIYYQAEVTLTYKDAETGETQTISALSNIAGVSYSWGSAGTPEDGTPPVATIDSVPTTKAYAELKEGSVYNETFEAMAGVPSTRPLYFSTGGSEFIVDLQAEYEYSTLATRTYRSLFKEVDCEYKSGDTFKGLSAGQTKTETFVADENDNTEKSSVTAEANNMVNPSGAASYNTTTNDHDSDTKIYAYWTGTIANNTDEPAYSVEYEASSGCPCTGSAGHPYQKGTADTNWDVSAYNTALAQAIAWAEQMEAISAEETGSAWRIADSDGVQRQHEEPADSDHHEQFVWKEQSGGTRTAKRDGMLKTNLPHSSAIFSECRKMRRIVL